MPLVSVVIPTHHRPNLVMNAVACALDQTYRNLEIIVVVDGADDETERRLGTVESDRLRVFVNEVAQGNAAARNRGVTEARGEWIALLDDDDLWLPEKLDQQFTIADGLMGLPVVSCRLIARSETKDFVWPRRLPEADQPVADYLFCRRSPQTGEGLVQTSTILAPRQLFENVPFDDDLSRYVDLDWMLRAAKEDHFSLHFVEGDPLVVWSIDEDRPRISNSADWRFDVEWARDRRHLMTDRAYGAFLLTLASLRARRASDPTAFVPLLREAIGNGRVSVGELIFHLGNFGVPGPARRMLAGGVVNKRARESG